MTDPSAPTDPASDERTGHVYEYGPTPPSEAVVEAVTTVVDRSTADVPSLYDVVDPDALDAAMGNGVAMRTRFTYADHEVVVTPGRVYVRPLDRS